MRFNAAVEMARDTREILVELGRRYAFRELAHLVGRGATRLALDQRAIARVQQLCAYGQRLLDLDAEDFSNPDATEGSNTDTSVAVRFADVRVPEHLLRRGRLCHIRRRPRERTRDALVSLHPAFRLLLEAIAVRCRRGESPALVATLHIASEYASLLAWEPYLGHAADPNRLRADPAFAGALSRWGRIDDAACRHPRPYAAAARRALRVASEGAEGWQSYLDRQHSTVSHALGFCATACAAPCSVLLSHAEPDRAHLIEAAQLAGAFSRSAIIRLRHAAPVGHGFGVPSPAEVHEAWRRSRALLAGKGGLGAAVLTEDGFPLPGLPSLFSAIAGAPITPDTLIADTAGEAIACIDPHQTVS